MDHQNAVGLVQKIIAAVERRIPEYLAEEEDRKRNDGNCAICIIDDVGEVHGRMFGADKILRRHVFRIAWTKASQAWITGLKTGEFEKLVFTGKIDEHPFGILRPDFIGWEGGQPIELDSRTKVFAGFSGFRGSSDVEIVRKALAEVMPGAQAVAGAAPRRSNV